MTARFVRPISAAASWSRRLAVFSFVLFAATVLVHRLGLLSLPNAVAVAGVAGVLAALALLCAFIGLVRLWQVGARGGWASLAGLVLSGIVLLPIGYVGWLWVDRPGIREVSTDFQSEPAWIVPPEANQGWMRPPPAGDAALLRQMSAYPEIASHRYEGAVDRVLTAAKRAAADMHLAILATTTHGGRPAPAPAVPDEPLAGAPGATPAPLKADSPVPIPLARPAPPLSAVSAALPPARPAVVLIQATHRGLLFGFPSDVMIRLAEDADSTVVDVRVAARYGDHDLGTGAALINGFFKALDNELQGG
ncbi:MAG: DUF1499 domain-containing protein [Pararhizobium sp.]